VNNFAIKHVLHRKNTTFFSALFRVFDKFFNKIEESE